MVGCLDVTDGISFRLVNRGQRTWCPAGGVPVPATPHHGQSPPRLTLVPRRSGRTTKPPQRLRYDAAFNQIT
ncbi:hypothetical protein MRX96_056547 [Rhipicephalus microplus]